MVSKLTKLNILVAYPYFSDDIRAYLHTRDPSTFRLIVDSGAFTAWNTGAKVTMEGYVSFLRSLPKEWEYRAVQLDVYGNPQATYINWKKMLDMGFHDIMPVFTRGDEIERLEEYYAATDYIMFGGIAFGGENKNYIKFFSEANKGRKVHWLGFVNPQFMKHYKPESVDSSSITMTERYGTLAYYVGGGNMKTIQKAQFAQKPPQDFIDSCRKRGWSYNELKKLARSEAWVGAVLSPQRSQLKGFASFVGYTHHVARALDVERNIGTKVYLAFAALQAVVAGFEAYDFLKERGAI